MAKLNNKDFVRKIRQGNGEKLISLSNNFLTQKKLKVGDSIDLKTLEAAKEVKNES